MDRIKASNVWDDDYIAPGEKDKLRGERAKLYMELRDIDIRLQDLKYRQLRCRRMYSVCVLIAAFLLLVALLLAGWTLLIKGQPLSGLAASVIRVGILISALIAGISSVLFFSAMSVHSFWAGCANFLRIEKLEMHRLGWMREKRAIETRLAELEGKIHEPEEIIEGVKDR